MNPNITNNRTIEEIQNSNSFVVPTPQPTASDMTATLAGELQKATQQGQLEQAQAQEKIKAGETDVNSIFQQILGEAPERTQLEQQQGLPQQTKEFRDLQALQMQQTAEYLRGLETIGNKAITQEARGTGERALTRQRGIDAMITSSLLQAKQGNIEFAQNLVNSAIDAKYTPLKQTLAFKQDLLEKNYENLTRAEKKVADAKKDEWNLQMKEIEKNEEQERLAKDLAFQLQVNGATSDIINKAIKATSIQEIQQIEGVQRYLKSESERLSERLQKAQISKIYFDMQQAQLSGDVKQMEAFASQIAEMEADGELKSAQRQGAKQTLDKLEDIISNTRGLRASAGTTRLGRQGILGYSLGDKQKFLADVSQILDRKTLDELIDVKSKGATFGALSDSERVVLAQSATALNGYAKRDKNGKVVGFSGRESDVLKEINTIKAYAELSFIKAGGVLPGSEGEKLKADDFVQNIVGNALSTQPFQTLPGYNYDLD